MVDGIKIAFDVSLHDVAEYTVLELERKIADRIFGASVRPVSIGAV